LTLVNAVKVGQGDPLAASPSGPHLWPGQRRRRSAPVTIPAAVPRRRRPESCHSEPNPTGPSAFERAHKRASSDVAGSSGGGRRCRRRRARRMPSHGEDGTGATVGFSLRIRWRSNGSGAVVQTGISARLSTTCIGDGHDYGGGRSTATPAACYGHAKQQEEGEKGGGGSQWG
jgi:hypothetical protein